MEIFSRIGRQQESNNIFYYDEVCNAAKYLIGQVKDTGYISASSTYFFYTPHWFRDSSHIAIALDDFADFFKHANPELSEAAANAANRINTFNLRAIEYYTDSIKRALALKYEDKEFYMLSSHIPARISEHFGLFKGSDGKEQINDTMNDRWLVQYDTLPLVLLAIYNEQNTVGISEYEKNSIKEHAELWSSYLGKIYQTPSSDSWETPETNYIYFYNVAAIFKAKEVLKQFASSGIANITADKIEQLFNELYKNRGIIGALKDFVKDGIVYSRRMPFKEPDTYFGVDSEELFAFTKFGISNKELGEGVEEKTIKKIEEELFSNYMLPIRNLHDEYFCGGRWLLLGLEYANYKLSRGDIDSAKKRIDYIADNYSHSMPEQEILAPAHPESAYGAELIRNNKGPIQKLNWSFAAFIHSAIQFNIQFRIASEKAALRM
ncbi:MAG: hypothetical protein QXS17_01085 [Candidatus Micrarchaeaceae archaeon]